MIVKYNIEVPNTVIVEVLSKLTNQTYALLPMREEGADWEAPLQTLIEEFAGMERLLLSGYSIFFRLLCKLEGLFLLTDAEDFEIFRRTIFDCLGLIDKLKKSCQV